jgi:glutaconate CoA-transferase subunit B
MAEEVFKSSITDKEYEAYCKEMNLVPDAFGTIELLCIAGSKEMPEGASLFVGTGLPVLAVMEAQLTVNPTAIIIMEAGMLDPKFEHIPVSVADIRGCYMSSTALSMTVSFGMYEQRGYVTGGVLGGAEYDEYGNINATAIWDGKPRTYWPSLITKGMTSNEERRKFLKEGPNVRFTGSGGSNPIGQQSDFTLAIMVQEKRRFPYNCCYRTTMAAARGPEGETRWDYGACRGGKGIMASDLCIMENYPEEGSYDMRLRSVHPGCSLKDVVDNVMWELKDKSGKILKATDEMPFTPTPTVDELKELRMKVDPTRIYLSRKTVREVAQEKETGKPVLVKAAT